MPGLGQRLLDGFRRVVRRVGGATAVSRPGVAPAADTRLTDAESRPVGSPVVGADRRDYPGDYHGPLTLSYAPHPDDIPDPGEVVWTWVPFEEDYAQGKDRPVLIIARESETWLLALMLSSKDHDLDRAQEESEERFWLEIGSGPWDASGRRSAVRVNRVIRVDPTAVRRIGGRLDEDRFRQVAAALRAHYVG